MDFFEAQARAKKRTSRLLLLFALAVAGTIAAAYLAVILGLRAAANYEPSRRGESHYRVERDSTPQPLWQANIFGAVSVGTLIVVGLASLY